MTLPNADSHSAVLHITAESNAACCVGWLTTHNEHTGTPQRHNAPGAAAHGCTLFVECVLRSLTTTRSDVVLPTIGNDFSLLRYRV